MWRWSDEQDSSLRSEESSTQAPDTNCGITPGYGFENPPLEGFTNPVNPVPDWREEGVVIPQNGSQQRVSCVTACAPLLRESVTMQRYDMPSPGKQVLIVDNNDEESRTLASMLESAGHHPTTTWSGLEALELLKAREFDLVLVSSYLPDLYVGDFFERFNQLAVQPSSIVMQEGEGRAGSLTKLKSAIGSELHSKG